MKKPQKSAASEFLEDVLPKAVSSSLGKRFKSKKAKQGAGAPSQMQGHESPPHQSSDALGEEDDEEKYR